MKVLNFKAITVFLYDQKKKTTTKKQKTKKNPNKPKCYKSIQSRKKLILMSLFLKRGSKNIEKIILNARVEKLILPLSSACC